MSVPVLILALSAAKPRRIAELKRRGGPTDEDRARVSEVSARLADKADVLMRGGGEWARLARCSTNWSMRWQ
jgi:hypothetical protein